ncbi:uncharacterized protein LOC129913088 isoform X2 [Episyrphus balteatus]|nr:uncharacterized protein LOC129913088 isoform X2 [Episyrphus balteatus]
MYHMNIQWSLVRNKTRNLRILYEKAFNWQNTDDAQNMPDQLSKQSMIDRMCPHYKSLEEVFCNRINKDKPKSSPNEYNSTLEIEYAHDIEFKQIYSPPETPSSPPESSQHHSQHEQEQHFPPPVFENISVVNENLLSDHPIPQTPTHHPVKRKSIEPYTTASNSKHDASDCLMEVVKMMSSYLKERSEYQIARLDLESRKFDFEKEKTIRELELREKEMEKHERLQVMEIESKERIQMKELEYKYRQF